MKRVARMLLRVGLVVAAAKRGRRARRVYVEEVSTGSKPIEAVGTAMAAFFGLAPDRYHRLKTGKPSSR
jgi:hypothetical protein